MTFTDRIKIFFKDVWAEMKRVSWLSRKEVIIYTAVVLGATLAVAVFLGGLDAAFSEIIRRIVVR